LLGRLLRARLTTDVRARVVVLPALAAACSVAACGSSSTPNAATATATAAATATTPAPPPTRYRTRLDRALGQAFRSAFLLQPAPPTESQIPPKLQLLAADPPTVCTAQRRAAYRCIVTYQPTAVASQLRAVYELRRHGDCFTATAAAFEPGSTLHRISTC
jgi:hypothetical protein